MDGVDGETLRATEGREERDRMELPFPTALGFPHECIEAWVIAGLQPSDLERSQEIAAMKFDPFAHPERLSHKENVPKSAKDLKKRLGLGDADEKQSMVRLLALAEGASEGPVVRTGGQAFVRELGALLVALTGA